MSKLEQAIRKTASEGQLNSSIFDVDNTSCIEEIAKMETTFLFDQKELKKRKIIYPALKDTALINSFRELRTSITSQYGKNVIMVTSITPKAGTSFFARNIAAAIAFDASKTSLLMDCNLNSKNDLAKQFDISDKPGINDYILNRDMEVEDVINNSGVKRLRVVPFGSENSDFEEIFSHPRFHTLLGQLKHKYSDRNVIIDAPSILSSADARILLELCDQVIVVVPYGKGNRNQLESAAKIIGRDKLTGVVFNDFVK